jgi:hypothetical protein
MTGQPARPVYRVRCPAGHWFETTTQPGRPGKCKGGICEPRRSVRTPIDAKPQRGKRARTRAADKAPRAASEPRGPAVTARRAEPAAAATATARRTTAPEPAEPVASGLSYVRAAVLGLGADRLFPVPAARPFAAPAESPAASPTASPQPQRTRSARLAYVTVPNPYRNCEIMLPDESPCNKCVGNNSEWCYKVNGRPVCQRHYDIVRQHYPARCAYRLMGTWYNAPAN